MLQKVPYRQVYPDATPAQYKNRKSEHERSLRVMQLKDPNLDVNKMWQQDDEDEGSDNEGYLDQSRVRLDMSIIEQAYHLLDSVGSTGMTQKEIAKTLGMSKLNCRVVLRNMERCGYVDSFMRDVSRQRITS